MYFSPLKTHNARLSYKIIKFYFSIIQEPMANQKMDGNQEHFFKINIYPFTVPYIIDKKLSMVYTL